ncbi:Outer membrane protein SusF domain-containing protein [Prevotella merdae]|uniref:Outer membrane protein SusF domain-containing protein n=1 Tax=Prevotella merdae TaxID=2079531 RepID=UPI003F7EE5DF
MIKKILLGMTLLMGMVSCTEDFTDWGNPQTNSQKEAVAFGNGSVAPVDVINLADVNTEKVKVASIVAPTSSNAAYTPNYKINFDGQSFDIDADGNMATAELTSYIVDKYGKRPTERDIDATLDAWVSNGSTAVKMATSATFQVKAIPEAPVIEEGYYLVGDMFTTIEGETEISGWTKESAKAFKHSDKDVYEDPIFTISFETKKPDQYWKIIPKKNIDSGDIWAAGVVGPKVDGDDSMTGLLTNGDAKAGKIAKAGKYKLTINMMDYSYTLEEVNYDPFIYFIGATDGWTKAEQKLALVDDAKGVYTGYLYCADPNGWGNQFKFQRVAGSWDNEINSGAFSTFSGAATSEGGNISVNAGEGVYYFDVNLGEGTITATKVETMGIIGGFNNWDGDAVMTWNAEEYCFEATNVGVTADGWKFRVNGDWPINLGGSLNNLTAGGDNLTVAGNTVKLYPTRKTSENIYCTVE